MAAFIALKDMPAECFQEQHHFCLIFILFFDQNHHPHLPHLVLCHEQSVNNITRRIERAGCRGLTKTGLENGNGKSKLDVVWR